MPAKGRLNRLQRAFLRHGAAQCGACTPGMLVAATELLRASPRPRPSEVMDGLGGVLCRCTGYRKIVAAVLDAAGDAPQPLSTPPAGAAVGARLAKLDGVPKLTGAERYGADAVPADALWLRIVRSPHDSAKRRARRPGERWPPPGPAWNAMLTAADVPCNRVGIYPDLRDQPVLAEGVVRYRGDPVVALVGTREAVTALRDEDLPIRYEPLPPVRGLDEACAPGAPLVHDETPGNKLIEGGVERGDARAALAGCAVTAEGRFETAFVEHAYIEPEAGWARRVGERVELFVSTQTPVMDRDTTAEVLGLTPAQVRIVPSACGGGFGGKLDVSIQPLAALAAWLTGAPVACVYERPESMMASPKRHPAAIEARFGCDADGTLQAVAFDATFDTGAYASWGPTVAGRVPVHASGPYAVPHVSARGRAFYTNGPPAGAFRGFGVPQAAIAHEALMDDLADGLGMDRLEFRLKNALRAGDATATGHVLEASVGLAPCLEALAPRWQRALEEAARADAENGRVRRGVGIGCMWYGIGNTALSNPSAMRITLDREGRLVLYNGAVDIGQGSTTILAQICADALGVAADRIAQVIGDTDWTEDAGKTSASRQTFVSGKAAELAGVALRAAILREANAADDATVELAGAQVVIHDGGRRVEIDLAQLKADAAGRGAGGCRPLRPADHDARRQGPGHALRDLCLRRPGRGGRCGHGAWNRDARPHPCRPRCRARHQPNPGGGPDRGRHRPGHRARVDGGIPAGQDREPARLPDPDRRRRAGDRGDHRGGSGASGPLRRQGRGRARPGADRAGDPGCDPPRDGRARHQGPCPAPPPAPGAPRAGGAPVSAPKETRRAKDEGSIIRCDACPVLCRIREGKVGACDRYANAGGTLTRVDPLLVTERAETLVPFLDGAEDWDGGVVAQPERFVTGIGSGTTYPDYKPAPFIIASEAAGVDMVTVVSEGIFSYCGVKVKIDTDRHVGPEQASVRAEGEPIGHVTTAEYGSQMLSLGGVRHFTGGSKREGTVTCSTLLDLCNGKPATLTVDDGAELVVQAGAAPVVDGQHEERMRAGCGSAAMGMFARQWHGHADEVIVVDDQITGVLTEHQAGRFLDMPPSGIRIRGRRSTPGRYFQVARKGRGWAATDIADPLEIIEKIDPKKAWPGLRLHMVSTTGEDAAWFELDETLTPRPVPMPAEIETVVDRIAENCEPALCTVLFMAGAGGSLRAGVTENPVRLTRSIKDALTRVTAGGAPVHVWPGGGITFMVDVTSMPADAFGYVPTPALVAPIEFTLSRAEFVALGGHVDRIVPLEQALDDADHRAEPWPPANPWPLQERGS